MWPKWPHAVHVATFLFFATWGEFSSGFIVASSCWEVANSGEKCEGVINIDRNLMAWVGSNQWKERAHGVSFSLVRWVGSYNPWKFRLHRWIKKCKPTVPKIGLNFHRLYLHNHQELEAPVKIWLVNAATFNAAEPVCVGLESLNYFYVDLLFVFVGKSTTWPHYLWSSRKGLSEIIPAAPYGGRLMTWGRQKVLPRRFEVRLCKSPDLCLTRATPYHLAIEAPRKNTTMIFWLGFSAFWGKF